MEQQIIPTAETEPLSSRKTEQKKHLEAHVQNIYR